MNLSSLNSEREGEVPQALLGEGATCLRAPCLRRSSAGRNTHRQTQAPVIDRPARDRSAEVQKGAAISRMDIP